MPIANIRWDVVDRIVAEWDGGTPIDRDYVERIVRKYWRLDQKLPRVILSKSIMILYYKHTKVSKMSF